MASNISGGITKLTISFGSNLNCCIFINSLLSNPTYVRKEMMIPIITNIIVYGIFVFDSNNEPINTIPRNITTRYSDSSAIIAIISILIHS